MLREAQQGEFAHLNRNIEAIREALERMDARLQAVEGAPPNPNKRNRGGRNRIPQVDDVGDDAIDYITNDDDSIVRMSVPRGGDRGGRGLGRGKGRL